MPTPNEQDEEVYALLLSNKGRCADLATYREEIIASEREAAADRLEALRPTALRLGGYDVIAIDSGKTAVLSGQSASPPIGYISFDEIRGVAEYFNKSGRHVLAKELRDITYGKPQPESSASPCYGCKWVQRDTCESPDECTKENPATPLQEARDRENRLLNVLKDIGNPMIKLKEEAERVGATLNGYALQLCNDANWLKEKARAALAAEGRN
jgi:hypothetical protein